MEDVVEPEEYCGFMTLSDFDGGVLKLEGRVAWVGGVVNGDLLDTLRRTTEFN